MAKQIYSIRLIDTKNEPVVYGNSLHYYIESLGGDTVKLTLITSDGKTEYVYSSNNLTLEVVEKRNTSDRSER